MFPKDKKLKEIIDKIEFKQKKEDDELYTKRLNELDTIHSTAIKELLSKHKKEIQRIIESTEAEAKEKTKKYVKRVEGLLFEKELLIKKQQDYIENVDLQNKKLREAIEILKPLHLEIDNTLRRLNSFTALVNNASIEMKQNIERTSYELELKTFTYNKQAKKISELLGEVQGIDSKQQKIIYEK